MAITVNHATLARQVNGEIEYIYPKTTAELVEYDSTQNIKEKIDSIVTNTESNLENKVDKPLNEDGTVSNGEEGQILISNGNGSTSWIDKTDISEIDPTLSKEGAAAEAKAVGIAINDIEENISTMDQAINNLDEAINNMDDASKVNKPIDIVGNAYDGEEGQVLESNGDGSTSWVTRARVYVGDGDMPEGYDVQIDPDATTIEIDRTLSIDGAIAEASATGAAISVTREKITNDIATHNSDAAAHMDIRAMITDAKEYILMKDIVTGEEYKVVIENGELKIKSTTVKCTGISISANPTKTTYDIGDLFDPTGMVVTASYSDGSSKAVTSYTYTTAQLTAGTTSVPIYYIEGGVTFTASVPITLLIKCIGISITTYPTKVQYTAGETFDPTGMVITATYNDATTKTITDYTYSTTALAEGTTIVTISYVEDSTTFTVNVPITVVAAFDATATLQDFTYDTNSDGTYTLTGWKGTLNGVTGTECVVPDTSKVIVNPL